MPDSTYRIVELVGTSPAGITEATASAIARASQTMRELDWFEVTDIRGHLDNGEIKHFQVTVKVGFRIEETTA